MLPLQHALALFLFVGVPLWDVVETRALKTGTNPRRKLLSYQRIFLVLWITAIAVWGALRSRVFFIWPAVRQSMLGKISGSFVWGLIGAWVVVSLLRAFQRRKVKLRETTVTSLKRLEFFLPVTREERFWFAIVSVTAGICEEVLYRGFLIRYLSDQPWHIGLTLALIISSVAFGLAHGYQGISGIIGTGFIGAVMGVIFFITGSLWLPMALHALMDLNVLLLLRRGDLPVKQGAN